MKTLKKILKFSLFFIIGYACHLIIEATIIANIVSALGYKLPIFV